MFNPPATPRPFVAGNDPALDEQYAIYRALSNGYRVPKPPFSYAGMTAMAILMSPLDYLTVKEIQSDLQWMFPFFRGQYKGWKNSVRSELSMRPYFVRVDNPSKFPGYWYVDMKTLPMKIFKRTNNYFHRGYASTLHEHLGLTDFFDDIVMADDLKNKNMMNETNNQPLQDHQRESTPPVKEQNQVSVPNAAPVKEQNQVSVPNAAPVKEQNQVSVPNAAPVKEPNQVSVPNAAPVKEPNQVSVPNKSLVKEPNQVRVPNAALVKEPNHVPKHKPTKRDENRKVLCPLPSQVVSSKTRVQLWLDGQTFDHTREESPQNLPPTSSKTEVSKILNFVDSSTPASKSLVKTSSKNIRKGTQRADDLGLPPKCPTADDKEVRTKLTLPVNPASITSKDLPFGVDNILGIAANRGEPRDGPVDQQTETMETKPRATKISDDKKRKLPRKTTYHNYPQQNKKFKTESKGIPMTKCAHHPQIKPEPNQVTTQHHGNGETQLDWFTCYSDLLPLENIFMDVPYDVMEPEGFPDSPSSFGPYLMQYSELNNIPYMGNSQPPSPGK